jgi:hypothetical protein
MDGMMYGTMMYSMVMVVYRMMFGVMRRSVGLCSHRHSGDS